MLRHFVPIIVGLAVAAWLWVGMSASDAPLPEEPEPAPELKAPVIAKAPMAPLKPAAPPAPIAPATERAAEPFPEPEALELPETPEGWPSFVDFPPELAEASQEERRAFLVGVTEQYEATLREALASLEAHEQRLRDEAADGQDDDGRQADATEAEDVVLQEIRLGVDNLQGYIAALKPYAEP